MARGGQLEEELKNRNNSIRSLYQNMRNIEGTQIPTTRAGLQFLRSVASRITLVDLPNSLKPAEADVAQVQQSYGQFATDSGTRLEALQSLYGDVSAHIARLPLKIQGMSDLARSQVNEVVSDMHNARTTAEAFTGRVNELAAMSVECAALSAQFAARAGAVVRLHDRVSSFGNEYSAIAAAMGPHWQAALRAERQRLGELARLRAQAAEIWRAVSENLNVVSARLGGSRASFDASIGSLATSARGVAESARASVEGGYDSLEAQLQSFVSDSNTALDACMGEVESTIRALANLVSTGRDVVQGAISGLTRESAACEQDIVSHYDTLKLSLTEHLKRHAQSIRALQDGAADDIVRQCSTYLAPARADLAQAAALCERVPGLRIRANQLIAAIEERRSEAWAGTKRISDRLEVIRRTAEQKRGDLERRRAALDSRLAALEDQSGSDTAAAHEDLARIRDEVGDVLRSQLAQLDAHVRVLRDGLFAED